jgi:DNA polymerase-3 subunit alpha
MEALICTGAFDRFEARDLLYGNLEVMLSYNKEKVAGKEANQDSLFGEMEEVGGLTLYPADSISTDQKLIWEKDLLGVYVSGHPLDAFTEDIEKRTKVKAIRTAVDEDITIDILRMKGTLITAGMIESVRELITKKGDKMAFVLLSSKDSNVEMVTFPECFETHREMLIPGTCVAIKGKLSIRNDEPSILVDKMKRLGPVPEATGAVDTPTTKPIG